MTFQTLLPSASDVFVKAAEEVFGTALDAIEPEVIKTFWDPDLCPAEYLSVLAHALSVDLWNESWSELKKRSVLRRWVMLEFSKGTLQGYTDFIEIEGGTVKEYVLPPGGIFAAPDLTKEQWDAWTDQHPRVMIKLATRTGEWIAPLDTFADETFADEDFVGLDDGYVLRARRAVLREYAGAPDIDIQLVQLTTEESVRESVLTERVIIPAEDPVSIFADDGFSDDGFVNAVDTGQLSFSYQLSRSYIHRDSRLWLDTVPVGYEPRDTKYYRVSDIGDAGDDVFADDGGSDDCFATPDLAAELMGDVLYLHNPDIAAPMVDGNSFADHSRVDTRRFHAEFRIDLGVLAGPDDTYVDDSFADEAFAVPEDDTARESCFQAIGAARAKRDRVLVTFQNQRLRTLGDGFPLSKGAPIGGFVANTL